jgi:hypothetical protein
MNRSFLYGLVGLVGVAAVGLVPLACTAGGVGVPCTPEDEYSFRFPGFKVTEDIIESRSFQCATRICLVNHVQGRVSCPLGQPAPKDNQELEGCTPVFENGVYVAKQGSCKKGDICAEAGSFSPGCDPTQGADADNFCKGLGAGAKCNPAGFCQCETDADCVFVTDAVVSCDKKTKQCTSYACHKPGDCQQVGVPAEENAGKACCLPGTDTPVTTPVCGQCKGTADSATRSADAAVYCSCRCGVADGAPEENDFNFCTCPDGFECSEIRKNVGLGDQRITGKYCIKKETAYDANKDQCGNVDGYWVSGGDTGIKCAGVGTGKCQTANGPCDPN